MRARKFADADDVPVLRELQRSGRIQHHASAISAWGLRSQTTLAFRKSGEACVKFLGLKPDKWRQWLEVLAEERRSLTVWTVLKMAGYALVLPFRVNRREWRRRLRVCRKCPVYDRSLRRCRPYTGSPLGCGCSVWLLGMVKKRCWGDVHLPGEGIGWNANR